MPTRTMWWRNAPPSPSGAENQPRIPRLVFLFRKRRRSAGDTPLRGPCPNAARSAPDALRRPDAAAEATAAPGDRASLPQLSVTARLQTSPEPTTRMDRPAPPAGGAFGTPGISFSRAATCAARSLPPAADKAALDRGDADRNAACDRAGNCAQSRSTPGSKASPSPICCRQRSACLGSWRHVVRSAASSMLPLLSLALPVR